MSEPAAGGVHRLEASRERLRLAMRPGGADDSADRVRAAAAASGSGASPQEPVPSWLNRLREVPGLALLVDGIVQRWQGHPLRLAAQVAGGLADGWIKPVAQAHPVRLILGALAVGAALAWARPWRLLPRPARWSMLALPLVSRAVALVPMEAVLLALTSFAQQSIRRSSPPPRSPPPR